VEQARNRYFQGRIPEMGDEGRIPPHLDGVGDKLNADWIKHVLDRGAEDRPYMLTRMPRFGSGHVGRLVKAFESEDAQSSVTPVEFDLPPHRIKSIGRQMVGEGALGCIKCHNFGPHKATGIQSIDLTTMARRLRRDWFHRYMVNPQIYRSGTRMPTAWPNGRSVLPQVLDGETGPQLAAMWMYLEDGRSAAVPAGLLRDAIVLEPKDRPIIYRNFIDGLSARGIAVGYPEGANLAFDAETFSLALIWHGAFLDASEHWSDRGDGFQRPLGDHALALDGGVPLAELNDPSAPWPAASPQELGYQFRGYRLDELGRPTFAYRVDTVRVEDFPEPIAREPDPGLRRTLTITAGPSPPKLWFRAAVGRKSIETADQQHYIIDGAFTVRLHQPHGDATPVVRRVNGGPWELLVPLTFQDGEAKVIQEFAW
ncbi:MAG: PA14 domain-containing protein, partial [Planctomycetaceae bacterium]